MLKSVEPPEAFDDKAEKSRLCQFTQVTPGGFLEAGMPKPGCRGDQAAALSHADHTGAGWASGYRCFPQASSIVHWRMLPCWWSSLLFPFQDHPGSSSLIIFLPDFTIYKYHRGQREAVSLAPSPSVVNPLFRMLSRPGIVV